MLILFSRFKDAHTRYFIKQVDMDNKFIYKNNTVYLTGNGEFKC